MSTNQHGPVGVDPDDVPGEPGEGVPDARQRRTILITVCIALMAVIASVSGLNVAQPDLAVAFDASQSTILWIINIYTLGLASLLLPLGALGDRLGRKPVLVAGLVVFGLASAAAGLAPSAEVMLVARLFSGVGAAMIMPVTLAVITSTFPEEERGRAIGVWTGVAGGGGVLGMFLSAALVDVASWRWLFVLPLVLGAVALVMTLRSVPDSRERSGHGFDVGGALASVVAVVGLIFVLQEGPERGWTAPVTLLALVVGVIAAVGFVAWELRRGEGRSWTSGCSASAHWPGGLHHPAGGLRGAGGHLRGPLPVPPGRARLVRAAVHAGSHAHGRPDDGGLGSRAAARRAHRRSRDHGHGRSAGGWGARAHGRDRLGRRRLSVRPSRHAGDGPRHGPGDDALHRSHHRIAAARAAGGRVRAERRDPGVRYRSRCRPPRALLSAGYRGAIDDRLAGVPEGPAEMARGGVANAVEAANGAGPYAQELIRAGRESFVDGWQNAMWAGTVVMAALFLYVLVRGPRRPARTVASAEQPADPDAAERVDPTERVDATTASSRPGPGPGPASAPALQAMS